MLVMVLMTAPALMLMFMMVLMTAAASVFVLIMVMSTAAPVPVFMVMVFVMVLLVFFLRCFISGIDLHLTLHRPGDLRQLRDQGIGILRRQPQLLGRKGNGRLLHLLMGVELCLDLRRAVGTVQVFNDVYLLSHRISSFYILTYEQSFICYHQYTPHLPYCQ